MSKTKNGIGWCIQEYKKETGWEQYSMTYTIGTVIDPGRVYLHYLRCKFPDKEFRTYEVLS